MLKISDLKRRLWFVYTSISCYYAQIERKFILEHFSGNSVRDFVDGYLILPVYI